MLALAVASGVFAQNLKVGSKAPAFSGKASDGKTYDNKSLAAGPVLFYFIGHTCPVNALAVEHFNAIGKAYKGKARMIGVMDAGKQEYTDWQKQFNGQYPVIFDPEQKIIRAFKAERSPWAVLVGKDGKVLAEWQGYSVGYMKQMSTKLAAAAKIKAASLAFRGAPDAPRYG